MLSLLALLTAAHAGDGVFVCTRSASGGHRKGWTLSPGEGWLFSVDNDNQRYRLLLELPLPPESWACLSIGGRLIAASSVGQDLLATTASFDLTPAEARIISRRYDIPRRERVQLDAGLTVRFEAESAWTVGGPMPVILVLENQGSEAVAVTLGGRYRGAGRDNRFSFSLSHDGQALPDGLALARFYADPAWPARFARFDGAYLEGQARRDAEVRGALRRAIDAPPRRPARGRARS